MMQVELIDEADIEVPHNKKFTWKISNYTNSEMVI